MKKLIAFTCICLITSSAGFSQKLVEKKEKHKTTHSLGIYGGGGFNHLSKRRYLSSYDKNKVLDFGISYWCSFRPTVRVRIGAEGTYMYSDRTYSSAYQTKSKALHIALPVQFQYVFNPENKVQIYFGIGVSVSKWINTEESITLNDTTSVRLYKNGGSMKGANTGIEVLPMALIGLNAKIGNNFSIFLQPEYRPMIISKDNVRLRSLIVQLGFAYQFNRKK